MDENCMFIVRSVVILVILTSSCNGTFQDTLHIDLKNKWILSQAEEINSQSFLNNPNAGYPYIIFMDSSVVFCHGGCNTGSGTYHINHGIEISCGLTKMKCKTDRIMDWESLFINNLWLADGYIIEGDILKITTKGTHNLIFMIAIEN
jgi:heat shock protein HslJ